MSVCPAQASDSAVDQEGNVDTARPRPLPEWSSLYAGASVHMIGIGGCGMCGLAGVLLRCGARVSGSDRVLSAAVQRLSDAGVRLHIGQSGEQIPADCGLVVHSAAVSAQNPELLEAHRRELPVLKYADLLGRLMRLRSGIAVAGTHGKSTTTALMAYILRHAGLDPTFVVGAAVDQLGGSSGVGNGPHFVAEACEFDRSFLYLTPDRAAILNIEEDHLDCYPGLDAIVEAFATFAARVPPHGLLVANGEDRAVARAVEHANATIETFGFAPGCTWRAADPSHERGCYRFDVLFRDRPFLPVRLGYLAGRHNVLNALAATALAWSAGVERDAIATALRDFQGARRRLTLRGERDGLVVLDDYGHHPTEIQVTLRAVRERYPGRPVWCVFQPHQHSRTRFLLNDFARSFGAADHVLIPDIYFVRDSEAERQAVGSPDLVERIRAGGGDAVYFNSFEQIVRFIQERAAPGDVIVTMGAGDVWKVADELVRPVS